MPNIPVLSFNTGLLSPQIDARSDVEKYRSGCRVLENMIPRVYGPAERRPGTEYIASFRDHDSVGRVIPFIYSNTISYIVLLEPYEMRFFYDGAILLGDDGREVIVETPYGEADLFSLDTKQSNDVMWIVHADHAPRKLSRTAANAFSLDAITFTDGPFKKRNDLDAADGITMTPSAVTGTGITLTASSAYFDSDHVGALFKLTQARAITGQSGALTSPNTGYIGSEGASGILVEGDFVFTTEGIWTGTVTLQRSIDAGSSWETYRTWVANDQRNINYTGHEAENTIQYRVNVTALSSGTINTELTVKSSLQEGICKVTAFTSTTAVTVTILKDFGQTSATTRWAEGCWSPYRGYPTCVTFFEQRCIYAGTSHQPQTIWLSATDDFENFDECTKDDSAFSLTLDSDTRNAIRWLASLEAILIGTTGGEWRLRGGPYDEPLTPTSYNLRQQTTHGSADIQPIVVNDAALFVDFVSRKVRELTYDGDTSRFIAPDLTALAENITETGITSFAYQKNPDPILWCTLTDGMLLSTTYEREQNVVAWAEHPFSKGGATESDDTKYAPGTAYPTLVVADGTFATTEDDPGLDHHIPISNVTDLQNMKNNLTGHYYLTTNIDASDTANWNSGEGFEPIGTSGTNTEFCGTFDGCGHRIDGLYINRSGSSNVGFFGAVHSRAAGTNPKIANVTLKDCTVKGAKFVGCLIGALSNETNGVTRSVLVQNCHITGTSEVAFVGSSCWYMGGLIGVVSTGGSRAVTIVDCTADVTVDANDEHTDANPIEIGGFVGIVIGGSSITITNCRATGNVTAGGGSSRNVGGFAGSAEGYWTFQDCASTGDVIGDDDVGGFIGSCSSVDTYEGYCIRCSARGDVTANDEDAGGFFGYQGDAFFTDCYAWGDVTSGPTGYAGGFLGIDPWGISGTPAESYTDFMTNCYCIGRATSDNTVGGMVPYNQYGLTVVSCFWDTEASGLDTSAVGTGHITSWMKNRDNFIDADWNLDTVWYMPARVLWDSTTYSLGINSVAVIPSTSEDEVWVTVARLIDGEVKRYVERFKPRDFGDIEDAFFVDSGLTYDDVPEDTFTNLDHLEGETVVILGDGAVFGTQTVSSGSVTISDAVNKAHIGLAYTYKLKPMRFDLTTERGTTKGSIKRISKIVISLFESANVWYGPDSDNLKNIDFRTTEAHDTPPALFTGDKVVSFEGGFDPEDSVLITGSDPLPCTVRAIVPRLEITGP
jgi:hypothetical protein